MKNKILFSILFVGILFLNILSIHATLGDVGEGLEGSIEKIETTKGEVETKWDYLGREWQNIFLKNKIVSGADSLFKKMNIVFVVLFAENYSLSFGFFIIFILWLYFFLKFSEIFRDLSAFSSGVSTIIGFGLAIILAQTGFFRMISNFLMWLIFKPDAWWMRVIVAILIIAILLFLSKFGTAFGKSIKKQREEEEKEKTKASMKIINAVGDALSKAFGKGEKD